MTPKDKNAIKGAMRRAFSRSDLHRSTVSAAVVKHYDASRPKVKTWVKCAHCLKPEARSYVVVDHIDPVIPVFNSFLDMSLDEVAARMWCHPSNLQVLCGTCHDAKTASERKDRTLAKQAKRTSDAFVEYSNGRPRLPTLKGKAAKRKLRGKKRHRRSGGKA